MQTFLGGEFLAVVTFQLEVLFVDNVELGGDDLVVGNTHWVHALDNAINMVGNLGIQFLHHFVVFDVDDGGHGCHQGNHADFFFREVTILDFDDAFANMLLAGEVPVLTDG